MVFELPALFSTFMTTGKQNLDLKNKLTVENGKCISRDK